MEEKFLQAGTVTCIPRLRRRPRPSPTASAGTAASSAAPATLLDRLRDVALRLAMLSVASKGGVVPQATKAVAAPAPATTPSCRASVGSSAAARMSPSPRTCADSYRSEAVDECIQFLKRSAAGGAPDAVAATSAASPLHESAACES